MTRPEWEQAYWDAWETYYSDEHAERIKEKRRVEWGAPPKMVQISVVRDE